MKNFKNLLIDDQKPTLIVKLNRPEKLNSLNFEMLDELNEVIEDFYTDDMYRGMIITGVGNKAFAAGADITEFANLNEINGRKASEKGQEIFDRIENCYKPIIAAVNGYALGGGCELALSCHIRIASKNAKFGLPEVNLGIIPGYGGTQRLPRLIGKGRAMEMILTGEFIDAGKAESWGLVNHVVETENLINESMELLNKIYFKAPLAVSMVIESVNASSGSTTNGFQTEANFFGHCCNTEDFKEGVDAFMNKRKAEFKGK
jgi:enoyl-CoA hydratase